MFATIRQMDNFLNWKELCQINKKNSKSVGKWVLYVSKVITEIEIQILRKDTQQLHHS